MHLHGIYTPLITPFRADLAVDTDAYAAVIDHQLEHGIHGLIVGGSTGEFYALTPAERAAQLEFAARRIDGRAPLIAGVNDLRSPDCLAVAAAARDAGAEALLVGAPPYALPSAAELVAHLEDVDRVAKLPIVLYNYPARTGVDMGEEFLRAAVGIDNVVAIKESSGDISRLHTLVSDFPGLQVSAGAEDLVLEFFAWGAESWVSVIANFMPAEAVALHRACIVDGDFALGRKLVRALLPLLHCLEHGGAFIQCVKLACEARGRPGGPVRPPLRAPSPELAATVADIVGEAGRELDRLLAA
mgnify:CR=1 FL=1